MRSKCDTQVCLLMCDYLNVLPKSAHAMHLACFLRRLKPSHTRWNHLLTALSTSRCGYLWASCSMSSFCLLHPLPSFCNIGIGIYHLGKRAASLVLYAPTGPDGYHCGHCVSQWRPQRREVPWGALNCISIAFFLTRWYSQALIWGVKCITISAREEPRRATQPTTKSELWAERRSRLRENLLPLSKHSMNNTIIEILGTGVLRKLQVLRAIRTRISFFVQMDYFDALVILGSNYHLSSLPLSAVVALVSGCHSWPYLCFYW